MNSTITKDGEWYDEDCGMSDMKKVIRVKTSNEHANGLGVDYATHHITYPYTLVNMS